MGSLPVPIIQAELSPSPAGSFPRRCGCVAGQLLTPSLSLLQYTMFMCCAILITIVQYCNFCQLSSWMRSLLATVVGAVLLILLYVSLCPAR